MDLDWIWVYTMKDDSRGMGDARTQKCSKNKLTRPQTRHMMNEQVYALASAYLPQVLRPVKVLVTPLPRLNLINSPLPHSYSSS